MEDGSFVRLGDALSEHGIAMQTQYASRYLTGLEGAHLGDGLRVDLTGYESGGNYHAILIHRDDAAEFCRRVREYRLSIGASV